jgi:hypothetical protein
VVELDADVAFEQDRWRHAVTLVRVRPDLRPGDLACHPTPWSLRPSS